VLHTDGQCGQVDPRAPDMANSICKKRTSTLNIFGCLLICLFFVVTGCNGNDESKTSSTRGPVIREVKAQNVAQPDRGRVQDGRIKSQNIKTH
jgi:hypothetical protein